MMDREISFRMEEEGIVVTEGSLPSVVVLILYNCQNECFLLQRRNRSNAVLGGETVFPSEKGLSSNSSKWILQKCLDEECGGIVPVEVTELNPFLVDEVGKWGRGLLLPMLVTKWSGDLIDTDQDKGKFDWIHRDNVMTELTLDLSKTLFLIALTNMGLIKSSDFELAPKMLTPKLSR